MATEIVLRTNYFSRLQQIEQLGKEAVAQGRTKDADHLRKLWIATQAHIRAHETCSRCYGIPNAWQTFPHVNSGKCLRCDDTGLVEKGGNSRKFHTVGQSAATSQETTR